MVALAVVTAVDMLSTLCSAAGVTLPEGYASDGENLSDALSGKAVSRTRPIFWEWHGATREPQRGLHCPVGPRPRSLTETSGFGPSGLRNERC